MDFRSLPDDCLATIISLTSPVDASRLSLISTFFNSVASSDAVWVKFLPADYQKLIPASTSVSSLKAVFLSLCENPVLIEDGTKSFSLDKRSGKRCYMFSARCLSIIWSDNPRYWKWISLPDSRFAEVAELIAVCWFEIRGRINTALLSPMTNYKTFLVFKMAQRAYGFDDEPIEATVGLVGSQGSTRTVYVDVEREDDTENGHQNPVSREDGWFEVELGEFFNEGDEDGELEVHVLRFNGSWKRGIIIQGWEVRPN